MSSNYKIYWCNATALGKMFDCSAIKVNQGLQQIGLLDAHKQPTERALEAEIFDESNGWWKRFAIADLLEDELKWQPLKPRRRAVLKLNLPCQVLMTHRTHSQRGRVLAALRARLEYTLQGDQVFIVTLGNGDQVNANWLQPVNQ